MRKVIFLRVTHNNINFKVVFIMSKKVSKVLIEVLKAVVYALAGFFSNSVV